ncbi:MAG: hypothetical protein ABW277_11595 [Longimicrobiaceae bacterium]
MRHTLFPTLLGLLAAALAAGCGDAPTGVSPASARIAANGTAPLNVYATCNGFSGWHYDCTAYAWGGSGLGYSFTWTNAYEGVDYEEGVSTAVASCDGNSYFTFPLSLSVTAMDSNGATATMSLSLPCPVDPYS